MEFNITAVSKDVSKDIIQIEEAMKLSKDCARACYSEKNFYEIKKEPLSLPLLEKMIKSGHHSILEHVWIGFYMDGLPKILAMVFNNEKQYATSEKSARYTEMKEIIPEQKEKYDKWVSILAPEINRVFPRIKQERNNAIKKLAQENARYMTSVFTPTKMVHSINFRQINFLRNEFEDFISLYSNSEDIFMKRVSKSMEYFLKQTELLKISGLRNQTARSLSLFNETKVEEHFGDVYSTSYLMSFAGLGQAQRHRTINYHISKGLSLNAPLGFFVPDIVQENKKDEWLNDLEQVSRYDFPQAQLVEVNERGIIEDFISKRMLRECGHAQYEIMRNTLGTSKKYSQHDKRIVFDEKPKCGPNGCKGCSWGNKYGIRRKV